MFCLLFLSQGLSAIRGDDKTGDQNGTVGGTGAAAPDSIASPSSSANAAVGVVCDVGVVEMKVDSESACGDSNTAASSVILDKTEDSTGTENKDEGKGEGEGEGEKCVMVAGSAIEPGVEAGAGASVIVGHSEASQSTADNGEKKENIDNTVEENSKDQETVDLSVARAPVASTVVSTESLDNAESKV
jgi:hypothetical protein